MSLPAGTHLGPYEILAPLGAGGMGEVYRARDARLGRDVAVKVLPEHLARDAEALARFEREARAVAALSHPNILAIFDVGAERGIHFVVTELLEGETLRKRLAGSELPWRKAAEFGIAIAEGLAAAHAKGITHRDIKPENLFLTTDGHVKILDFGLARVKTPFGVPETGVDGETDTGAILGTVGYMSPEQVRGQPVNAPSDIFSLGCVLYEMIAGRRAFSKNTPPETLTAILRENPPELARSGKQISADLDRLIQHCLEKSPHDRFQSARDLAFNLKAILTGSGATKPVAATTAAAIDSVAVLPFVNASGNPEMEYLSDGITESLINSLSQISGLRLVPRSRVFRYKGQDVDAKKVGRQLKVRALLMGRVMQRGDVLNVQAELVDVAKEAQLWGERYHRKVADIFEVEEEIARHIAEKLKVKLSGEEEKKLGKRYTENTEAYQLYLKARYHFNRRTAEDIQRGIDYCRQAIAKDPDYALVYSAMADCYVILSIFAPIPGKELMANAKIAAAKAVEIDPTLAEAHTSLGAARFFGDRDWAGAEREFHRAIELNPGYWLAHSWYAIIAASVGRAEIALPESKRAQELDPLSLVIHHLAGLALYLAHRYDEAIAICRKGLELDPHYGLLRFWLGLALVAQRQHEEGITELEKAWRGLGPLASGSVGYAYAVAGRRNQAQKVFDELQELARSKYVDPFQFAIVHAGLGETDMAFECLEKAREDGSGILALYIKTWPALDSLRPDPRFADLVRRLGLPP